MSFGKASYAKKEFKKKKHVDLSDGDVVARIFPPFASLQDDPNGWHSYHVAHFGYKNKEGKHRPFESPEVSTYDSTTKKRTIEVRDPAMERLNELKGKLEATTKSLKDAETAGDRDTYDKLKPLQEKLNKLVGFKGVYNVDRNHHLNVMFLDGSAGELKLRHKAFLLLKEEIDALDAKGIDPLSLEDGRFFLFQRSGMGNETNFKVSVYKEQVEAIVNGKTKMLEEDKVSVVTPADVERIKGDLFDLDKLFERPTAEEVAKIVETSDLMTGVSPACDILFDEKWKATRAAAKTSAPASAAPTSSQATTIPTGAGTPNTATTAPATTATLATVTATPTAATTAPAEVVVDAPKTVATTSIKEMSDEDFFKEMGVEV